MKDRLDRAAIAAMQALVVNLRNDNPQTLAKQAVQFAAALISEVDAYEQNEHAERLR
jgi:hypothetical protein